MAERLPRGPHGLSREEVELSQRARLLQATTDAVAELGYVRTTVADILSRAGVSRATFYRMFRDREEAFLAAYAANASLIAEVMTVVRTEGDTPLDRLDRVLDIYLVALRDSPALARVFLVEVYAAGPDAARQRQESLEQFVDIVAETHRGETGVLGTLKRQRFAAQAFVGAVSAMVTNLVSTGELERLPALRRPLMELAAQITGASAGRPTKS